MQNQTVARRYATAIFNLARDAGRIDRVGADLRSATNAIYGKDDVRRFFLSPVFGRDQKLELLARAFDGKLDDIARNTILLLVRKRREALLGEIASEYERLALESAGKEPLEIVSARALDQSEIDEIVARLGRSSGKRYDVRTRTDAALLGGVRLTTSDRRVDGSLAARIDDLARELSTSRA